MMDDRITKKKEQIEQQKTQLEDQLQNRRDKKTISQILLHLLLIIMIVAFVGSVAAVWFLQTHIAEMNMKNILKQNLKDVRQDITDASNGNLEYYASYAAMFLDNSERTGQDVYYLEYLQENGLDNCEHSMLLYLAYLLELREVMIIDEKGIVSDSTEESFIGFDMSSGEQSAEFLCLLDGETETYVQAYGPIAKDRSVYRKFAGAAFEERAGFVQVSYDADQFQDDIAYNVDGITNNRHVGAEGFIIIADQTGKIVSGTSELRGKTIEEAGLEMPEEVIENVMTTRNLNGRNFRCMVSIDEGFYVVAAIPESELERSRNLTVAALVLIEFITFINLYVGVFRLLKREMADKLKAVTMTLDNITDGKMDEAVDVRGNREFVALSKDINEMVDSLKNYVAAENKRIEKELEYAREIQLSALPGIFPPYPDRTDEFDIFAEMTPAKEVGGDFYDFFLLNNDKLVILVADVSGKGIPAALFMMRAKSLIKSATVSSQDPGTIFSVVNNVLCEGNSADMFVTSWLGIIDLKSGAMEFSNAGHNIPLLRHSDGEYEYLQQKTNFVLAGLSGVRYTTQKLQLNHGDELFLYTDGVPEATNGEVELYGDERLKNRLNTRRYLTTAREICRSVHADVNSFVGDAPQFDDMTLLSFRYL